MSSRNALLTRSQRDAAPVLWRALSAARRAVGQGERSAARIRKLIEREVAAEPQLRLDYTAVVDARTLAPISKLTGRVLIPVAAYLGRTRLIDNVEFTVSGAGS